MDNRNLSILKEILVLVRVIKEKYKKPKCTAREIEILLYLYLNKNTKTLKTISLELSIVEPVISKYIKNLSSAELIDKKSRSSTEKLDLMLKKISNIDVIYNFIKKLRKVYDEKKCTLSEIEILLFIISNPKSTITDIYKNLKLTQSSVSKLVQKMCALEFVEKKEKTFIPSEKLLAFIDYSLS